MACVEADVKRIPCCQVVGVLAAVALSSCAMGPYSYGGYGGGYGGDSGSPYGGDPPANNAAPWVATGLAVAALAAYANEREHRHDRKEAAWWYRNSRYGRHAYCPPPPPRCW